MDDIDKQLSTCINGFSERESPQSPPSKPGDPQIAALGQYLAGLKLREDEVLVDFGSGLGMTAHTATDVWGECQAIPIYWAVDVPELLDSLSLPSRIHNVSKKFTVEEFLERQLPRSDNKISIVILRNVLHEMTISDTARLVAGLRNNLKTHAEVYIQDLERLRRPERGNAAWHCDLLKELLQNVGFDCSVVNQESFSGVPWFSIIARPQAGRVDLHLVTDLCLRTRAKQLERVEDELLSITKDYRRETTPQCLYLQNDFCSLSLQLKDVIPEAYRKSFQLEALEIPLIQAAMDKFDFAIAMPNDVISTTGLVAFLSSKNLLDFPQLIRKGREFVELGGYSQGPLFKNPSNIDALQQLAKSSCKIRILVVDPDSDSARLRSLEPVYRSPESFLSAIHDTINGSREFYENLSSRLGETHATEYFEIRKTARVPPWSYFIIDDICYVSLYSRLLTGIKGPCLVFKSTPGVVNNYYQLMRQDFDELFAEAKPILSRRGPE